MLSSELTNEFPSELFHLKYKFSVISEGCIYE